MFSPLRPSSAVRLKCYWEGSVLHISIRSNWVEPQRLSHPPVELVKLSQPTQPETQFTLSWATRSFILSSSYHDTHNMRFYTIQFVSCLQSFAALDQSSLKKQPHQSSTTGDYLYTWGWQHSQLFITEDYKETEVCRPWQCQATGPTSGPQVLYHLTVITGVVEGWG